MIVATADALARRGAAAARSGGHAAPVEFREQGFRRHLGVAKHCDLDRHLIAKLCCLDVDLRDDGAGRDQLAFLGRPLRQAGAEGDDAITFPASCYVDESAQIIGDVVLGEHASVWMNAVLRGDVYAIRIGAHSNVQDCSVLHGMKNQYGVTLGEYVTVGHSVTLHGCVVEGRCLIGMGSIILNGAKIGAGSIIAAGTLIPERTVVEPGSLWMGSPGKFRRKVDEKDQESIMKYARNYLGYTEEYLREK